MSKKTLFIVFATILFASCASVEKHNLQISKRHSVEDLHQDFTHAFLVTFGSVEDRAIYLPHPDHQEFVKMLTPMLEDVLVIDYWADK